MPQRIPSPRELQYHTQSIMQNALIRKKLEEQRENYRKRQEQEQKEIMQKQENEKKTRQDIQPSDNQVVTPEEKQNNESPSKKMSSGVPPAIQQQVQRAHAPSPNIFTPTSVLRKMTAEKDGESSKMVGDKKKAITGQPIRGQQNQQQMISPQQQQQPQQHPFMGNVSQFERMMQQNEAFGNINWDAQSPIKPQQQGPGKLDIFCVFKSFEFHFFFSFFIRSSNCKVSSSNTIAKSNAAIASTTTTTKSTSATIAEYNTTIAISANDAKAQHADDADEAIEETTNG